MKKINYFKISLDLLMAIVFVLLFNKMAVAGLQFHEIAGLAIGVAFILHIVVNFKMLHISVSYFALLLVGVYIGLHWNWAMNVFKKILTIPEKNKILGIVSKVLVVMVLSFGLYNTYSVNYFSKVSSVVSSFSGNQFPIQAGEGNIKGGNNTSIINILSTYLSIISVFSIITYYFEKLLTMKKHKKSTDV